ncbi:MAG: prephenate dehydrogenase [Saprospiraceae bacterium]
MTICIIGIGLIGGSIARDVREKGLARRIIGVEKKTVHAREALALGVADEILPLEKALAASDFIICATPVDHLSDLLPRVLDLIGPEQVVIDVGSTKSAVLEAVERHPRRDRFVATHPMAGTEYSGPGAAISGLFSGKCCVLCDRAASAPDALEKVQQFYTALGMHLVELDGAAHDLHVAYVSHISHIASFALALTVLEKEREEARIFELASGGFSSTVRLAKSNADTWIPIFQQNRENVLDVLDEYINTVSRFRTLLIKKDFGAFDQLIRKANDIRRILHP